MCCVCAHACTHTSVQLKALLNVNQMCISPPHIPMYVLGQTKEVHEPILCMYIIMYIRMYIHTISKDMSIVMETANCFASSNVIGGGDGVGVGVGSISNDTR